MFRDIRYALRLLGRSRAFAATAIVSMACGIAACTTVFSLAYAVLFRPLAVPRAEDVVAIYGSSRTKGTVAAISMPDYQDLSRRIDLFDGIGAFFRQPLIVDTGEETERVVAELPTGSHHTMLGLRPALGRLLLPADDRAGAAPVLVLSHGYWQRRFGASPSVIGRHMRIQDVAFEVVGVAPPTFAGVLLDWYAAPDMWLPLSQLERINERFRKLGLISKREFPWLQVTARLRRDVTIEGVAAALQTHASNLAREYPTTHKDMTFVAMRASRARFWPGRRATVIDFAAVLLASAIVLLSIALLNVANLLLVRMMTRQREIGIRMAVGGSCSNIVRQLLIEGFVLSVLATATSIPLSVIGTRWLGKMRLPFVESRALDLSADWRIFGAVALLCGVVGLLLGTVPAWRAWRSDVRETLRTSPSSNVRRTWLGRWDLRCTLAALQIAVSLILTLGAGLLGKSLLGLKTSDLGYRTDEILLFGMDTLSGRSQAQGVTLGHPLLTRVRQLPEVRSAGYASNVLPSPMSLTKVITLPTGADDSHGSNGAATIALRYNYVSAGYLETLQIPLVSGRGFDERDTELNPTSVAILSETAARRLWGSVDRGVGQRIRLDGERSDREVIGVTRNAAYAEVGESPILFLFLPLDKNWQGAATLHVGGTGKIQTLIADVQRELRAVDRGVAFSEVRLLEEHVAHRIAAPTMAAALSITASISGVGLALLGLYSVLTHLVSQRQIELSIRMSLGAEPRHAVGFVLGFAMRIAATGVAVGLAGAAFGMPAIAKQLRGVAVDDPIVYTVVVLAVMGLAFLASLVPGLGAARMKPWEVLRR